MGEYLLAKRHSGLVPWKRMKLAQPATNNHSAATVINFEDLPKDPFLSVLSYLSTRDIVCGVLSTSRFLTQAGKGLSLSLRTKRCPYWVIYLLRTRGWRCSSLSIQLNVSTEG